MKNKLAKKTLAAVMALAIVGGTMPATFSGTLLTSTPLVASAEGNAAFDEETGVLTLSGNITSSDMTPYKDNIKKIVCTAGTVLPDDSSELFAKSTIGKVEEIDLSSADTSKVTNMKSMFYEQFSLKSLNISNFNTSNVTNMYKMFYFCSNLTSLDVSSFNTSSVTDMSGMFQNCYALSSLDVSNFDTSNVTDMAGMFGGLRNISSLNVTSFNTSKVTNMAGMFGACYELANLDLSSFDTKNVTKMYNMFIFSYFKTIYVSDGWSTEKVNDSDSMFYGCKILTGDKGTKYDDIHTDKEFARPDGGAGYEGYLTYVSAPTPAVKAKVKGASLTLDGKIGVNFYVEAPSTVKKAVLDGPNGKVVFSAAQIKGTRQYEGDYKDTYKLSYYINSNQAGETIKVAFYGEDDTAPIDVYNSSDIKDNDGFIEYSANDYIANITAAPSTNKKLNNLVSALDNYCKASENYFDNKNHTIGGISNINSLEDLPKRTQYYNKDVGFPGEISLVLNSGTSFRIYIDSYINKLNAPPIIGIGYKLLITDNPQITSCASGNSKYGKYYETLQIPAHSILQDYYWELKQKDNSEKIRYYFSPVYEYARRVFNNPDSDPKLKDLVKALCVYGEAAIQY